MTQVDPRLEHIPKELLENQDSRVYFEGLERFLHDIWVRTGGGADDIAQASSDTNRKADTLLYAVLDKVSLGDPLTSDTTGFTVDSTVLYSDMDES